MNEIFELRKKIKRRYRNGPDNIGRDFVAPCLKNSKLYRRGTGFFSSGALISYAAAINTLIDEKTKIQIICSPVIQDRTLIDVLENNITEEQKEKTLSNLTNSIVLRALGFQMDTGRRDYKRDILAYLIAKDILEIRFAIPKNFKCVIERGESELTSNLYHVKTGYFLLGDSEVVGFDGSFNESDSGHQFHVDQTQVWRSWEPADKERLSDIVESVDEDWSGSNPFITTMKMSREAIEYAKSIAPSTRPEAKNYQKLKSRETQGGLEPPTDRPKLRHYQEEAIKAWMSTYRGIIALATGTGKTRTALEAIKRFRGKMNAGIVLITVPYQALAHQWIDLLEAEGYQCSKVFEDHKNWGTMVETIFDSNVSATAGAKGLPILVCVNRTFLSDRFQAIIQKPQPKAAGRMIIVDECHHLNKKDKVTKLPKSFQYRIGLSATPYEEGEERYLDEYFDKIVYEYSIGEAIRDRYLCPYDYKPILIELSADEVQRYAEVSKKIQQRNGEGKNSESLEIEIDGILENVVAKLDSLEQIIKEYGPEPYVLFYCGTGTIELPNGERIRQIETLTRLLAGNKWKVAHVTAEESTAERERIFEQFMEKNIHALASIRVLDEGIDIPDCSKAFVLASQRSVRQAIQRRGRILRLGENKGKAVLYDFIITGPKLSNSELNKLYDRELGRARMFAKDALNAEECLDLIDRV